MHLLQQSKQSVLLHPFIWISLFEDVAAKQIPVIPNTSIHNSTYEQFFHAFLKLIAQEGLLWNTRSLQDDGTHRMNLQDALHFGLYNHIETHLLKILVDFDVYKKNTEMSSHIHLLLSIITYILSTDSFQTVDHEEQLEHSSEIYYCKHCLAILIFAVQDLRICVKDNTLISASECTAISTIISKIITSSCFINEQKPQSRKLWKIRSDVIHMLLQMDSVPLISTSGLHMYTLPLKWHDIIYPLVFEVRGTKGWKRHDIYILAHCVINTKTLLMNDIDGGDTTAVLATFINLNLLDIARHTMYIYPWSNLLQAYISAVWQLQRKTKRANPDAEVHINYIHHSPNLFSICAIVGGQLAGCSTGQEGRKNIDMTLKKLASLCPHNTTWPTCLWVVNRLSKDEIYLSNKKYLDIDIKHKQAQQRPYKPDEVKAIMDHLQHSVVILREHVTESPDSSFQPLSHFIIDSNSVGEQSNV
ncbi:hypothetical protein EV421DRAFT_1261332 [Armillaria borealis]|uniref:Uncharacterized protein n=1 Tax=Armillaria borealis TaxID=47425 RepID=A0AA39MIT7_9AGAR|nr:hypothetical protein EV421DRAFT_1261332 [Armillaria borealis]